LAPDPPPHMNPKAFICHASEDKEGFVLPFATALRANGVDASLDKWEVLAGDSLPQKLFGALDRAEFIIPVLSPYSVAKPWVTAELDFAVVKRIEGEARIIPINLGLDRRDIPAPLRALKWVLVNDPGNLRPALEEVLDAIFQRSRKPPLGPAPGFTDVAAPDLPNLAHSDVIVLKKLFEAGTENDYFSVDTESPSQRSAELGITEQSFTEALEVLRCEGYVSFERGHRRRDPHRRVDLACGRGVLQNLDFRLPRTCPADPGRDHQPTGRENAREQVSGREAQ
jgi:hypothetical protein